MKPYLLLAFLVMLLACKASAQQEVDLKDIKKHIGQEVTIYDTVYDYKMVSRTYKELFVGARYPNQKLTVVIKGTNLKIGQSLLKKHLCGFKGVVTLHDGRLEILATERGQVFGFETSE